MFRQVGATPPENLRSKIRYLITHKHHLQVRSPLYRYLSYRAWQLPTSEVCCKHHERDCFQQQKLFVSFFDLLRLGSLWWLSNLCYQPDWIQIFRRLRRLWVWFRLHYRIHGCQLQARHDQGCRKRIPQELHFSCLLQRWKFRWLHQTCGHHQR